MQAWGMRYKQIAGLCQMHAANARAVAFGNVSCRDEQASTYREARFLSDLFPRTSSEIDPKSARRRTRMLQLLWRLWTEDDGQDIAEYALMLAVVLLIVLASVSAIGTNANTVFNSVASQLTSA